VDPYDPYASRQPDPYGDPLRRTVDGGTDDEFDEYDDEPESAEEEALELTADMLAAPREKRFDFERGMARFPPLTVGLVLLLFAVFGWELATGALRNEQAIIRAGALERNRVLQGELWRIPASIHLHGSADHLLGNCLGLFLMGLAVEHAFGLMGAGLLYAVAGVAGAVLCMAFEGGPTVGASGAIFGWWGAAIAFYFRYRRRLLTRDVRVGFVLFLWAGWTILTGFLSPHVSNFSHLGGLAAGMAVAYLLPTRLVELHPTPPS
jgi:rhomboid protease GluP